MITQITFPYKDNWLMYVAAFTGLMIGNIIWTLLTGGKDWERCADRTYFQGVAIFAMWILPVASKIVNIIPLSLR
jgi:hypothetical protein